MSAIPRPAMRALGVRRTRRWRTAAGALGAALLVGVLGIPGPSSAADEPWMNASLSPDRRADLLSRVMTLEQKVALFNVNGEVTVPALGIPPRHEIDGTSGVHQSELPATAMPSALALASSRNRRLARQWGRQTSTEAFAFGYDGNAAPTMDVVRSPFWGRTWETFGEDPILSGILGASEIRGVQSVEGVYALVKHFGVYNQETGRAQLDNVIDQATMRGTYLRNWAIAARAARPGAVMCAFPKINGEYACESRRLLTRILKREWGWPGFVSTDVNAGHSWSMFEAGTDVAGAPWVGPALLDQVRTGAIPKARFEDMVHRILRTMFAQGLFDRRAPGTTGGAIEPPQPLTEPVVARGEEIARDAAVRGSVLLRNSGVLPLSSERTRSLAVIGSGADEYLTGTGSPQVPQPARLTTILEGLQRRAAGASVVYAEGTDPMRLGDVLPGPPAVQSSVLTPSGGAGAGLTAQYFANPDFSGQPFIQRTDPQVNIRTGLSALIETFDEHTRLDPGPVPSPLLVQPGSVRWTGTLRPVASGRYTLSLTHLGAATLYLSGERVLNDPGTTLNVQRVPVDLTAGQSYDVRIDYSADAPNQCCPVTDRPGPTIRFGWVPPVDAATPQMQRAVEVARAVDTAVVVVRDDVGEGTDRYTLTLPQSQDALVRAVARVNPRTVVVSATSGPVLMPWLRRVEAVVQSWYPGEAGGSALASLLYGDANFTGRLPLTFPASEEQVGGIVSGANPVADFSALAPTVRYPERWAMGYRGYLAKKQRPLFPFGYGLSYSRVRYQSVRARDVKRGKTGYAVVRVRNRSRRAVTEPVHVYVGRLPGRVSTPIRQLAGVKLVRLGPGRTARVRVAIDRRVLEHWSNARRRWVAPTGRVRVFTGPSAEQLRRSDVFRVTPRRRS
ncbi:beta-glucosidase [Nocardioides houyundeii]|uniref:beta-glucosidase n=1 Tax=Nocardioides houyundeii TaxID=2045452 RepID=UPI000C79031A|nr:beta-glucosidase [Nocardioides houyundeii]